MTRSAQLVLARPVALHPRAGPAAGLGNRKPFPSTQVSRSLHRDSNYTIGLIEHDMRVVFHLADRICVLDQGKMLAQGTPQEIAANETVQAAYLGTAA